MNTKRKGKEAVTKGWNGHVIEPFWECVGVSFFFFASKGLHLHNLLIFALTGVCVSHLDYAAVIIWQKCVCVCVCVCVHPPPSLSLCLYKFQFFFPPLGGALPLPQESPSLPASSPSLWMWLPALRLKRRMDQWWNNKRMDMIPRYPLFLQLWPFSPTGTSMCLISAVCLCSDLAGLHLHLVLKCISGILT